MSSDTITRGEGRRVVSTKLYRSEYVNLIKICEVEKNKSVHQKLRELIQKEIQRINQEDNNILKRMRADQENFGEKIRSKFKLEIKNGV